MTHNNKNLKIVYLSGPVNASHVYHCWLERAEDTRYFGTHYLLQFYQVCHDLQLDTHVISLLEGETLKHNGNVIEYCPVPLVDSQGMVYHAAQIYYFLRFIVRVILLQADIVLVTPSRQNWFMLSVLPIFNIKVVPSIHCVLWPKFKKPSRFHAFLLKLTKHFFINSCAAILAASDDIVLQVEELTNSRNKPAFTFLPTYSREQFKADSERKQANSKFSVLFVGRIESDKGIYTILEIAKMFKADGVEGITFELCGTGSQLDNLKTVTEREGLQGSLIIHGFCEKPRLKKIYQMSSVVIVPTTKDFIEGFNQVLAESILSGKPAITSAVCPALSILKEAVVEVPPEDSEAYARAILQMRDDRELYTKKCCACLELQEKFYDESNSWKHQFKFVIENYVLKPMQKRELKHVKS